MPRQYLKTHILRDFIMETSTITVNEREIEVDNEGYLLDPGDWNLDVANKMAEIINIDMTEHHWAVVNYVRDSFDNRYAVPEFRHALKFLKEKLGKDLVNRKFVYKLFPYGYGQQACKIAGMRKPLKIILDL